MKLYMHPVSTTSRPVVLFMADNRIEAENVVIDLMTGEHMGEAYGEINPNHLVPVLEDGDFRLTESSAILKYLADTVDSPAYPKDLQARAKVNAMMDWLNADFYRDWGYGLIYPQIFPHHKRQSDEAQTATMDWARERSRGRLDILDQDWIGPSQAYLCGDEVTIADYFGMGIFSLGEVVRCDLSAYPNVGRWIGNMKSRPNWDSVNETFYGFVGSVREQPFTGL